MRHVRRVIKGGESRLFGQVAGIFDCSGQLLMHLDDFWLSFRQCLIGETERRGADN